MSGFQKLISLFEREYYSGLLLIIIEIIALVIGLKLIKDQKLGRLFLFYLLVDLIIILSDYLLLAFSNKSIYEIRFFIHLTNVLISLIELFVYSYFFIKVLNNPYFTIFFRVSFAIFLFIFIIYLLTQFKFLNFNTRYTSSLITVLGFTILIPGCIKYYRNIILNKSNYDLFERPSFWVTTGFFFYSIISIPFNLMFNYIIYTESSYRFIFSALLYNIPFALNFIFLIKSFSCRQPLTI